MCPQAKALTLHVYRPPTLGQEFACRYRQLVPPVPTPKNTSRHAHVWFRVDPQNQKYPSQTPPHMSVGEGTGVGLVPPDQKFNVWWAGLPRPRYYSVYV